MALGAVLMNYMGFYVASLARAGAPRGRRRCSSDGSRGRSAAWPPSSCSASCSRSRCSRACGPTRTRGLRRGAALLIAAAAGIAADWILKALLAPHWRAALAGRPALARRTGWPQLPQNFAPGDERRVALRAQRRRRGGAATLPQLPQNFDPGGRRGLALRAGRGRGHRGAAVAAELRARRHRGLALRDRRTIAAGGAARRAAGRRAAARAGLVAHRARDHPRHHHPDARRPGRGRPRARLARGCSPRPRSRARP